MTAYNPPRMKPALAVSALLALAGAAGDGCGPLNTPYPGAEERQSVYYSHFDEDPKDLDPGVSYNANEYVFLGQIYEPPLQYKYLVRPYTLEPLTLEAMPEIRHYGADGSLLSPDAPPEQVARAVYECRIKPGIRYQPHPCFSPPSRETVEKLPSLVTSLDVFPDQGTRELVAADYVHAIRRLASPRVNCPIRETLMKYLQGMEDYYNALDKDLEAERARRKAAAGAAYNQEYDEKSNPIVLDLGRRPFPGVEETGRHTFRITLSKPYPQLLYWMAMPFFSPVPPEAETFYARPEMIERNITLHRFPVGTGPFLLSLFDSNRRIVLARNPSYRVDPYPSEGSEEDRRSGLLDDAGKPVPFLDKAVYMLEKEPTPIWSKFLQGYYDLSTIHSDNFERAVSLSPDGTPEISGELAEKKIRLFREAEMSVRYFAFNMRDPLVGGLEERKRKLRQAIGIAIDTEERIQIFANGRGVAGMCPIPPGLFGHESGREAIDPYVYDWDERAGIARRKRIEEAKRLLAEAGYPGGIGPDGKQLVIRFDNMWASPSLQPQLQWVQNQLSKIGVFLKIETTDYNRFQDKVHSGAHQMIPWGWNADYPDPENFLFLFYGPNARSEKHGENASNYANPEFDALFRRFENLPNGDERLELIRKMHAILQRDAPWVGYYFTVAFELEHCWVRNLKPNLIANNTLKYRRVDIDLRHRLRREWNRPYWTPVWASALALLSLSIPAIAIAWKRRRSAGW